MANSISRRPSSWASELAASGIDGLVVCGTTGEAAMLDAQEQTLLLDSVLEAVGPRFPVVMGVGGSDTRQVVGHGTALPRPPAGGPADLRARLCTPVAGRHRAPLPGHRRSHRPVHRAGQRAGAHRRADHATAALLARDSHFVAIKEAGGSLQQFAELLLETRLDVLCGDDALLLASLSMGGHGAMSAAAQVRPDLYAQLHHLVRQGRHGAAGALFKAMLPVIRLLFAEPNPAPVKAALAMQGKVREELRLPMTPMSAAGQPRWPTRWSI
jgi:4-hydroxy-tetrahydrodipicolinate synthase